MVNEVDVTIRGYIGHDPTLMHGEGKVPYLRLNVGSTPRIRDREGQWSDGATQWFAVKFFGEFAVNVARSIRRGDAVVARGRLEHEEYVSRDGEDRWSATIIANAFGPDLRHAEANVRRSSWAAEVAQRAAERAQHGLPDVSGMEEVPENWDTRTDQAEFGTGDADGADDPQHDGADPGELASTDRPVSEELLVERVSA
ncbi:single-stranded DNA-binding protein [Ruania alkalisoli]|uniref:Single-stranded DNA-binding protein n=1 Tax=Ruania alkalisoli TaxID=2779775 RepID=A0A7M1SYA3_9MICO|nr:single-stranded DNA-binding protein [Ruania alkalisoli]QOR71964.1 single-stranded DNA-binding protein [Ruania alkalisoli]